MASLSRLEKAVRATVLSASSTIEINLRQSISKVIGSNFCPISIPPELVDSSWITIVGAKNLEQ